MLNLILSKILNLFQVGLQAQQAQMISFVSNIFILSAVLWVTFQGFLAMAGKTEAPIKDTIFKLGSLIVIYSIATEPQWINFTNGLVDATKSGLSIGGDNIYQIMDKLTSNGIGIFEQGMKKFNVFMGNTYIALINGVLVLISSIIVSVSIGFSLIINELLLKFLLAISPLFIFCLSFQLIRGMFNNWMQLIIANGLTFVFISLITGNILALSNKVNPDILNLDYGILMILVALLTKYIKSILEVSAEKIATVSAEGVGNAIGTRAGSAVNRQVGRAGYITGKAVGRGAVAGGKAVVSGTQQYIINPITKRLHDYLNKN